jgi:hypothetical protein
MGISAGPNIVRDSSLVLDLDASDRNSYISGSLIWKDVSGNNITGSLTNGPTYSSSNGGTILFDGTNDYVTCGTVSNAITSANLISVFAWFKCDSTTNGPLVFRTNDYTTGWNMLVLNGLLRSTLRPSVGNNNNIHAGTILTGSWYYGGFTCDNTTIRQYLNGIEVYSTPVGTTLNLNNNDVLKIGGHNIYGQQTIQGMISKVEIYNKALSATEVQQNYNALKSRFGLR